MFLSDMSQLPSVVLMGDTSQGSGNWQHITRELPEGWYVTCPTVTLLTGEMTVVEDHGVLPDVPVEATSTDFQNGFDPVLEAAFAWLGARAP